MRIKFPIGDWSDDGHGHCEWFVVESNKSPEQLREIHFSCKEKLGFDVGSLCGNYGDSSISPEVTQKLLELGVIENDDDSVIEGSFHPSDFGDGPEILVTIWLKVLAILDPTFEFSIVEEEPMPWINFYGFDDKQRHLKVPGYGLFF